MGILKAKALLFMEMIASTKDLGIMGMHMGMAYLRFMTYQDMKVTGTVVSIMDKALILLLLMPSIPALGCMGSIME